MGQPTILHIRYLPEFELLYFRYIGNFPGTCFAIDLKNPDLIVTGAPTLELQVPSLEEAAFLIGALARYKDRSGITRLTRLLLQRLQDVEE